MNFSFRRFAKTLRKDVSDHRRGIITFAAGSMTLLFVADTVITIANAGLRMDGLTEILGTFNVFFFFLAVTLVTSTSFRMLGKKASASDMLMLPASDMEKFLSRWLLVIPGVLLLLAVETYLGDVLASGAASLFYKVGNRGTFGWINYSSQSLDRPLFISCLLFLQSFFFLGSLLWPRFSWGKSMISVTFLSILFISVITAVIFSMKLPHGMVNTEVVGREGLIAFTLVMTVILYIISFFRFREAEIINRW